MAKEVLLNLNQVARRLGVDVGTARKIARKLPAFEIRRAIFYPLEPVLEIAKSRRLHASIGEAAAGTLPAVKRNA